MSNPLRHRQTGASLLEVLIAILIMSFGLLALAGLAASSQQYVKLSQFQSIASQLATDYGERMRSNVDGFTSNAYNKTSAYLVDSIVPAGCTAAACDATEIAAADQADWLARLRFGLPNGDAYVLRDTTNPLAADIWILWSEPSLANDAASSLQAQTFSSSDCPAAAIASLANGQPVPRCAYFRISL